MGARTLAKTTNTFHSVVSAWSTSFLFADVGLTLSLILLTYQLERSPIKISALPTASQASNFFVCMPSRASVMFLMLPFNLDMIHLSRTFIERFSFWGGC